MTEEDVKRIIAEQMAGKAPALDNNTAQWLVRSAFEAGWRAGGGDPVRSDYRDEPVGWRIAWLESEPRAILVRKGMISGSEAWK